MATKAKPKSRKAPAKKKADSQFPAAFVANHRFPPGTEVGFYPSTDVNVERQTNRAPFPKATETEKVAKDGSLDITGLDGGSWTAAAEVDGAWVYLNFSVKD